MTPRTRRDKRAYRACYFVLALFVFATWLSTQAKADPETVESYAFRNATAVCGMLSNDDSDAGIASVINVLVSHGVTPYQAGEVLGLSTLNVCPQFNDRVLDWAHTVTGVAPVYAASQKVGGVIGA